MMADNQEKAKQASRSSTPVWQEVGSSSTAENNSIADQEQGVDHVVIPAAMECEDGGKPSPLINNTSSDTMADTNDDCNLEDDKAFSISFPVLELARLDEMISNPRWVVPVLPGSQLEVLLDAAINLCKKGLDVQSEPCQRFFREGLTISFTKILTDDAVSSWKPEIHKCILKNSEKLVELIVTKLNQDWFTLLDLLGILFNPTNKFHTFNSSRPPESYALDTPLADDELFARHIETRLVKGWLVDLINLFGTLGGFQILMERFTNGAQLSVSLVYALLKPFGLCADYLTKHTVEKYFSVIFKIVPAFLENLSDEELKKETAKSDIISSIIRCLKCLEARVASDTDEHMRNLELFRLRMILRMLQVSSFNGKMNALNEINQVIQNVQSYYPHHHRLDEVEYLTGKRIAEWIAENQVLQIILRDSLHQPQYVEKIEKILRFIIKERTLTLSDLDHIWAAQVGKHDAIVKNLHDLLAKLAWDFSPEQLDHLFECFQASWTTANKRQREKLLELIRRLAEDDKDGVMAFKVLTLFWNLAHSNEVPTEIMDQALTAHVKVLDYSCSQRDNQKYQWLNTSMAQMLEDDVVWVIPAMKHMREIFSLYPEGTGTHKNASTVFRCAVVRKIQTERSLVVKVCESLYNYEERVRNYIKEKGPVEAHALKLDGRYSHLDQIRERLYFLRFLLKEGQLLLCKEQAFLIWECLAESPAYPSDREMCFEWFSKLMGDDHDLDPELADLFFTSKILTLDATLLTDNGMECFERFFKAVNVARKKIVLKRDEYLMDDLDMEGTDYVWKIILSGTEDMASRAIQFLRSIFTALGPGLLPKQKEVHEDFLSCCADRLKSSYDTILVLEKDKDSINRVRQELTRISRVSRVLLEYVGECDSDYGEERAFLPLYRACRGRSLVIYVRIPSQIGRGFDDMEVHTHTNETMAGLQRQILRQLKQQNHLNSNFKLDLCYNGDVINVSDDRQIVDSVGLRDKMMLNAKILPGNATNSPDSSEESSGGSPNHFQNGIDGPNIELEESLPSVMLSMDEKRMEFLCLLMELASRMNDDRLREVVRNLLVVLPACRQTEKILQNALQQTDKKACYLLFNTNHAAVLYRLEVLHAILFPAVGWDSSPTLQLLKMFFVSGIAGSVVEMLTKNNFMPLADTATKRSAYLIVLKLSKAVLTVMAHILVRHEAENRLNMDRLRVLSDALQNIPPPNELVLRKIANSISHPLYAIIKDGSQHSEGLRQLLKSTLSGEFPDCETIRLVMKLASSTASGSFSYFASEHHQSNKNPTEDDVHVCEEALEVLTLSFVLNPQTLEQMLNDQHWKGFICNVLVETMNRHIRIIAVDQLYSIAVKCTGNVNILLFFINFLFEIIKSSVLDAPFHSVEVFHLLCHLLRYACNFKIVIPRHEQLLQSQIEWLKNAKVLIRENGEGSVQEELLEGFVCVARDLVGFLNSEKKYQLGCDPIGGNSLIQEILEEYIFPWSKAHSVMKKSGELASESPMQICSSPMAQNSVLELVISLCTNCYQNLQLTVELLTNLFSYSNDGDGVLTEWEYVPPVGNRPLGGFVGLKNAGATCYMNSVLQQLFMVENIRKGILGASTLDPDVDEGIEDVSRPGTVISRCQSDSSILESNTSGASDDRKSYNISILKQIQSIFGHLALSKLQYHVPNGLWKNFRLQGEAVNLREQQDAVEFFMNLIDSVDDGLKALGEEQVMSKNLGGLFSDQKISKECIHRYSKEEPFSVISVDIRNHSNLLDSLEQYVKGDLLEGADAYYCERCNKKVVTVKRLCVKKLPPVLAIQLKRFEYDYERVCSVKFNDYFEFPRELEMEPYTVSGLAKIEGEIIDDDATLLAQNVCTSYRLTGIVVHSGQASGGHYYSYISYRCPDGVFRWFKFDDGDVSECRMSDDEELKNQCFGGDYSGEVFDHMMKRMSFRRQKRWWNAYILFYTQTDILDPTNLLNGKMAALSVASPEKKLLIPSGIERSVLKQNVEFMHIKSHFSMEYFQFVKKLLTANLHYVQVQQGAQPTEEIEQLALLSVQLATKFLFTIGFRTKKPLRGAANDWYEILSYYLRVSKKVRFWFANHALFSSPCRTCEYLLECPSTEIRATFSKILVILANTSKDDGVYLPSIPMITLTRSTDKNAYLWEYILEAVLNLLRRDVSEYGRHLVQYFNFFVSYANIGDEEKLHLINHDVPATFMLVALEDGPCPPIKYQCADLSKLYQVVSILIRSCDVSHKCKTSSPDYELRPNPFIEPTVAEPLTILPENVCDIIYGKGHIKKVLDEAYSAEDTISLIQFLCWENIQFSQIAIAEVLGHIGYSYSPELRTFLDILMSLVRIDDSWQQERIGFALKGFLDEKDGLIEIIHRNKQSHPKRTYLFMKCVTAILEPNSEDHKVLIQDADLLKKWNAAVDWLQHELERRAPTGGSSYGYSGTGWSPPSNETTNGSFFLERSLSAKSTLDKAVLLKYEPESVEKEDDAISSEGEGDDWETRNPNMTVEEDAISDNPVSESYTARPGLTSWSDYGVTSMPGYSLPLVTTTTAVTQDSEEAIQALINLENKNTNPESSEDVAGVKRQAKLKNPKKQDELWPSGNVAKVEPQPQKGKDDELLERK